MSTENCCSNGVYSLNDKVHNRNTSYIIQSGVVRYEHKCVNIVLYLLHNVCVIQGYTGTGKCTLSTENCCTDGVYSHYNEVHTRNTSYIIPSGVVSYEHKCVNIVVYLLHNACVIQVIQGYTGTGKCTLSTENCCTNILVTTKYTHEIQVTQYY